jgi:hypothetical protein
MIPIFITPENTGASFPEKLMSLPSPQTNKQTKPQDNLTKRCILVFRRDDLRNPVHRGLNVECGL